MICESQTRKYCREDISKIENYDKAIEDNTQMWVCHHRNEQFYTQKELKALGKYYNISANELIFLTPKQHGNYNIHKGRGKEYRMHHSKMLINNPKISRKICQYSEDGNFINSFPSLAEAYRLTGIRQGNIWSVCNGSRPFAGGYYWRYEK